jgi:hypothetical protein
MGKPTNEELQQAITTAIAMRESGHDQDHVAKTLLSLNYRMQKMERLAGCGEALSARGPECDRSPHPAAGGTGGGESQCGRR